MAEQRCEQSRHQAGVAETPTDFRQAQHPGIKSSDHIPSYNEAAEQYPGTLLHPIGEDGCSVQQVATV